MYDTEFYLNTYEVKNTKTGRTFLKPGKYRDVTECKPHEELILDSANCVPGDRQTLYCIPVPGETSWVKEEFSRRGRCEVLASSSVQQARHKRSLDGENAECSHGDNGHTIDSCTEDAESVNMDCLGATVNSEQKRSRTTPSQSSQLGQEPNLNFPLPDSKGPACLVKVYDQADQFKVNDVVEFFGVLSIDPVLANFRESDVEEEMIEEEEARHPPPSLVPRLHVIVYHKLDHVNPLMPSLNSSEGKLVMENFVSTLLKETREELVAMFSEALLGDKIAAEYLLLHLLSTVYARKDITTLGKLSLNLIGSPDGLCTYLYRLLEQLVTKILMLPLTVQNLNQMKFIPRKDYTTNRLNTGLLQLGANTHLLFDETCMQPGQLDASGVKNLTAIGNVIVWQKLDYDFQFHTQEFHTNIPVLVFSQGKSLLTCDVCVRLHPTVSEPDLDSRFQSVHSHLTNDLLTKFRTYLTLIRLMQYLLPEETQKVVEDDFVQMRQDSNAKISADDLHLLLSVARWLSLSHGATSLTTDMWKRTKVLEQLRKAQLASFGPTL